MLFSRNDKPSAAQQCQDKCKGQKAKDDTLSTATQRRIESFTGRPEPATGLLSTDGSPSLLSADSSP